MDTYERSIYDPDTLHKYLYANGNPVTYITSYPFVIIPVSGHALHRLQQLYELQYYLRLSRNIQESFFHYCNSRLKSANTLTAGRDLSDFACDNPVSIMELNSSVVRESNEGGSFGKDKENGILLVIMICL